MAKGLGQAIGILSIAMAAYEIYEQVNKDAKTEEQQRGYEQQINEVRAQFRELADTMSAQLNNIYQKEYVLPVIDFILEKLQTARDEVLTQEAVNKEIVENLSSHRVALMGMLRQLYDDDQLEAS